MSVADPSPGVFVGAGALAICAMILPGISGSFILLMIGMYAAVITAVHDDAGGDLLLEMQVDHLLAPRRGCPELGSNRRAAAGRGQRAIAARLGRNYRVEEANFILLLALPTTR